MNSNDLTSQIEKLILELEQSQKEKLSKERSDRMKTTVLADSTILKAMELVRKNKISVINERTFLVIGSSNENYHVMKSEKYGLVCINTAKKSICCGWKFKKNCKHCQSVRIFSKKNLIMTNLAFHPHTFVLVCDNFQSVCDILN